MLPRSTVNSSGTPGGYAFRQIFDPQFAAKGFEALLRPAPDGVTGGLVLPLAEDQRDVQRHSGGAQFLHRAEATLPSQTREPSDIHQRTGR